MAARQLQKLRAQQEASKVATDATSESEGESPEPVQAKVPFNPFSLLTDSEEEAAAEDSNASDGSAEAVLPAKPPAAAQHTQNTPFDKSTSPATGQSAKSKKKARRKAAEKAKGKAKAPDASPCQQQTKEEEDLDGLLQQFGVQARPSEQAELASGSSPSTSGRGPLLAVDVRNLRPDEEMRRIFGAKIVDAEERDEGGSMAGGSRRVRRLMARGLLRRTPLKKGLLITPKDHWPALEGGISMESAGFTADGKQLFKYTHSANYQAVQGSFEECQATFDPNNIAALLQHHPYHIDALLAMYELYRAMGEHAYAEEMLERCLYALEMAWHPWFSPQAANCRLDYGLPANRPLFAALFKHMQNLSRRGLHTTAMEYAKLLLALDPEDPLGALCCVDYFALRAQQFRFLHRLADEFDGDGSLRLLPNFAFSLALARFREAAAAASSVAAPKKGKPSAPSTASGALETVEGASEALAQAVQLHPFALICLMDRLKEQGVGKDAEWGSILRRPLFAKADAGGSASLEHLISIFVERHHLLYKAHDVQTWLKRACDRASDPSQAEAAADWAAVRSEVFPASPENEYRHLRVTDFSDTISRLPPEEMQAAMFGGAAPAGPDMPAGVTADDLAALHDGMQQLAQRVEQGGTVSEEDLQGTHPLAMLLRSMLPWINAGQVPDYEGGGEANADAPNGDHQDGH